MPAKFPFAIKGEKHFHLVDDDKLYLYRDLVQTLIFEYKDDCTVSDILNNIYCDISKELTERLSDKPVKAPMCTCTHKVFKSPAKRKG